LAAFASGAMMRICDPMLSALAQLLDISTGGFPCKRTHSVIRGRRVDHLVFAAHRSKLLQALSKKCHL
jgi:hypothetical protein